MSPTPTKFTAHWPNGLGKAHTLSGSRSALGRLLDDGAYREALSMALGRPAALDDVLFDLTIGRRDSVIGTWIPDYSRRPDQSVILTGPIVGATRKAMATDSKGRPLLVGALVLIPALIASLNEDNEQANTVVKLKFPSPDGFYPELALHSSSLFLAIEQDGGNCPVAADFLEALQKKEAEAAAAQAAATAAQPVAPAADSGSQPSGDSANQVRAPGDQNEGAQKGGEPLSDPVVTLPLTSPDTADHGGEANDNSNIVLKDDGSHIVADKDLRVMIDAVIDRLRYATDKDYTGFRAPDAVLRQSRSRSLALTKLQEACMWLGMDLKELGTPNPYPNSRDTTNTIVDPTAQGLRL